MWAVLICLLQLLQVDRGHPSLYGVLLTLAILLYSFSVEFSQKHSSSSALLSYAAYHLEPKVPGEVDSASLGVPEMMTSLGDVSNAAQVDGRLWSILTLVADLAGSRADLS